MSRRVEELSLFPDLQPNRYVGPLVQSVLRGDNAALVAEIAPLYFDGSVLDTTYGRGSWWRRFTPEPFTFHDIALDGVDFRALPHDDASFDAVCFDPPYIPGAITTNARIQRSFVEAYGLDGDGSGLSADEMAALMHDGIAECARVARRWLCVKCCDWSNGSGLVLGHLRVIERALELGLTVHDLIVHNTGPGPGGQTIAVPKRTRRAHSYLVVLTPPRRRAARTAQ